LIDEQCDRTRQKVGRAPHVLDRVTAWTVDADDDDIRFELAHAADEILRSFQAREQAIARSRQARLDDFGAGGIIVYQQDGQRLGHGSACIGLQPAGRNFHAIRSRR
jgi:hypothetical protein